MMHHSTAQATYNLDNNLGEKIVRGILQNRQIRRVAIYDDFKTLFAQQSRPLRKDFCILSKVLKPFFNIEKEYEKNLYYGENDMEVGSIVIKLDRPYIVQNFVNNLKLTILSDFIRNMILACILALLFYYSLTLPLQKISNSLSKIDFNNPADKSVPIIKKHSKDELGLLVSDINNLIKGFEDNLEQRNSAEQQVLEKEKFISTIIDNIPDALLTINKKGLVEGYNFAAKELFGYNNNLLKNISIDKLFDQITQQILYKKINSLDSGKQINGTDMPQGTTALCSNGETVSIELRCNRVKLQNKTLMVCVVRNIKRRMEIEKELLKYRLHLEKIVKDRTNQLEKTNAQLSQELVERKKSEEEKLRLERELIHAQKLESIGTLVAGIAHEINTPIQFIDNNIYFVSESIKQLLQLIDKFDELLAHTKNNKQILDTMDQLKEDISLDYLKDEVSIALEQTVEGLDRVTQIVNAMKGFSHLDNDNMAVLDINKSVKNTILVSTSTWKFIAEIKTDLDPKLPKVYCFPTDINQVIMNLIINACHTISDKIDDGTDEKGVIKIKTYKENDNVLISISDTGKGIQEKIQNKIFDPFFTTKDIGSGTGQGLSISYKNIVEKHKGKLTFKTILNQGTTFLIEVPINAQEISKIK